MERPEVTNYSKVTEYADALEEYSLQAVRAIDKLCERLAFMNDGTTKDDWKE